MFCSIKVLQIDFYRVRLNVLIQFVFIYVFVWVVITVHVIAARKARNQLHGLTQALICGISDKIMSRVCVLLPSYKMPLGN